MTHGHQVLDSTLLKPFSFMKTPFSLYITHFTLQNPLFLSLKHILPRKGKTPLTNSPLIQNTQKPTKNAFILSISVKS